ncbi:hypothetical protein [Mycetocola saprophilus]|uniref:hypothetical protein n=1 Tax=Mycetocola saprophilus TaxID=76636 RepID=UPI0004C29EFD|nr:hypothetical protein [Mycetocola saprophilus]
MTQDSPVLHSKPRWTAPVPQERHWPGTRLTMLGFGTGILILALGFVVPELSGASSTKAGVLHVMFLYVMAGAVVTTCVAEGVRRWSYSNAPLVVAATLVVGTALIVPFLVLPAIEAVTRLLDSRPIVANEYQFTEDLMAVTMLTGVMVILVALAAVLLWWPPKRPTLWVHRLRVLFNWLAPFLVFAWIVVTLQGNAGPGPVSDRMVANYLAGGVMFSVLGGLMSLPGYAIAGVLALAFLVAAWVYSGWRGFDLRRRPLTARRAATIILILLSIPLLIVGWILAMPRLSEGVMGAMSFDSQPLTADQIPRIPITTLLAAAVLCLVGALLLHRSGAVLSVLAMTVLVAAVALSFSWTVATPRAWSLGTIGTSITATEHRPG